MVFVDEKGILYNKFYTQLPNEQQPLNPSTVITTKNDPNNTFFPPFPIAENFESYEEFEEAVSQWYLSVCKKRLESNLSLPQVLGRSFARPTIIFDETKDDSTQALFTPRTEPMTPRQETINELMGFLSPKSSESNNTSNTNTHNTNINNTNANNNNNTTDSISCTNASSLKSSEDLLLRNSNNSIESPTNSPCIPKISEKTASAIGVKERMSSGQQLVSSPQMERISGLMGKGSENLSEEEQSNLSGEESASFVKRQSEASFLEKVSSGINLGEVKWSASLAPIEPNPTHYSSYLDYKLAMKKWLFLSSQTCNLPPLPSQLALLFHILPSSKLKLLNSPQLLSHNSQQHNSSSSPHQNPKSLNNIVLMSNDTTSAILFRFKWNSSSTLHSSPSLSFQHRLLSSLSSLSSTTASLDLEEEKTEKRKKSVLSDFLDKKRDDEKSKRGDLFAQIKSLNSKKMLKPVSENSLKGNEQPQTILQVKLKDKKSSGEQKQSGKSPETEKREKEEKKASGELKSKKVSLESNDNNSITAITDKKKSLESNDKKKSFAALKMKLSREFENKDEEVDSKKGRQGSLLGGIFSVSTTSLFQSYPLPLKVSFIFESKLKKMISNPKLTTPLPTPSPSFPPSSLFFSPTASGRSSGRLRVWSAWKPTCQLYSLPPLNTLSSSLLCLRQFQQTQNAQNLSPPTLRPFPPTLPPFPSMDKVELEWLIPSFSFLSLDLHKLNSQREYLQSLNKKYTQVNDLKRRELWFTYNSPSLLISSSNAFSSHSLKVQLLCKEGKTHLLSNFSNFPQHNYNKKNQDEKNEKNEDGKNEDEKNEKNEDGKNEDEKNEDEKNEDGKNEEEKNEDGKNEDEKNSFLASLILDHQLLVDAFMSLLSSKFLVSSPNNEKEEEEVLGEMVLRNCGGEKSNETLEELLDVLEENNLFQLISPQFPGHNQRALSLSKAAIFFLSLLQASNSNPSNFFFNQAFSQLELQFKSISSTTPATNSSTQSSNQSTPRTEDKKEDEGGKENREDKEDKEDQEDKELTRLLQNEGLLKNVKYHKRLVRLCECLEKLLPTRMDIFPFNEEVHLSVKKFVGKESMQRGGKQLRKIALKLVSASTLYYYLGVLHSILEQIFSNDTNTPNYDSHNGGGEREKGGNEKREGRREEEMREEEMREELKKVLEEVGNSKRKLMEEAVLPLLESNVEVLWHCLWGGGMRARTAQTSSFFVVSLMNLCKSSNEKLRRHLKSNLFSELERLAACKLKHSQMSCSVVLMYLLEGEEAEHSYWRERLLDYLCSVTPEMPNRFAENLCLPHKVKGLSSSSSEREKKLSSNNNSHISFLMKEIALKSLSSLSSSSSSKLELLPKIRFLFPEKKRSSVFSQLLSHLLYNVLKAKSSFQLELASNVSAVLAALSKASHSYSAFLLSKKREKEESLLRSLEVSEVLKLMVIALAPSSPLELLKGEEEQVSTYVASTEASKCVQVRENCMRIVCSELKNKASVKLLLSSQTCVRVVMEICQIQNEECRVLNELGWRAFYRVIYYYPKSVSLLSSKELLSVWLGFISTSKGNILLRNSLHYLSKLFLSTVDSKDHKKYLKLLVECFRGMSFFIKLHLVTTKFLREKPGQAFAALLQFYKALFTHPSLNKWFQEIQKTADYSETINSISTFLNLTPSKN